MATKDQQTVQPLASAASGKLGNAPIVGKIWESETLKSGVFHVTGGEQSIKGLGKWASEKFVGHRAVRDDGYSALVGLTQKPGNYPYDWVLTQ